MITLKKAYELANKYNSTGIPLQHSALDVDSYWLFDYDTKEVLIGPRPIAVNKKDGQAWLLFYPEHAKELDGAKEIPIPV